MRFFLKLAKMIMPVMILPSMLYAQTCLHASGQTAAFALAAGAKSSWNNPVALDKK